MSDQDVNESGERDDFDDSLSYEENEINRRLNDQHSRITKLPDALRVDMQRRIDELSSLEQQALRLWERMANVRGSDSRYESDWTSGGRIMLLGGVAIAIVAGLWNGISIGLGILVAGLAIMFAMRLFNVVYRAKYLDGMDAEEEALRQRWTMAGNSLADLEGPRRVYDFTDGHATLRSRLDYDGWKYLSREHHLRKFDR